MRLAAIDIGSNSVRLLVADVTGDGRTGWQIRAVARAGEPCRLGKGLTSTGQIEADTAERAAELCMGFADRAKALGAVHTLVGATAAIRNATNGSSVAAAIEERSGLPVRVLTGEEEARTVYRSVVAGLGSVAATSSCVVFDIGGGSTEVVSGAGHEPGRWVSLPIGAVSLSERFDVGDPPDPTALENMRSAVYELIMSQCAYLPAEAPLFAGVGGTITVLALLDRGIKAYDPVQLEGWLIPNDRLRSLIDHLVSLSHEERRRLPAMGEGRADIVVAGAVVVQALAKRFPSQGLLCSTQGLRYGLVRLAAEEVM